MKLHHMIAISLLAVASAGAQAATTLSGPTGLAGSTDTLSDTDSAYTIHENGAFTDSWSLVVDETTGAANVGINISDIHGSILGYSINIDNLSVTGEPTFIGSSNGDSWLYAGHLVNGTYSFTVTGNATGDNTFGTASIGGAYITSLNATPAPVPLPPAALLFGSALVALVGLRRKKAA